MTPLFAKRLSRVAAIGILTFVIAFVSAALLPAWAAEPMPIQHVKKLQELAEKGDAKAQYELAQAYFDGKGVDLDYVKALRLLLMAEKQGYLRLGAMTLDYKIPASSRPEVRGKIEKAFEKSLELAQRTGDVKEQAICFLGIGTIWTSKGESENKLKYFENALEAYRKVGDIPGEMVTLMEMSESVSDSKQAIEYAAQSLEAARKTGSAKGKREALERIVLLYQGLKKPQEALGFLKSGLDIEKQNNDLAGITQYLARIADLYNSMDQRSSAKETCEEAARIAQKDGEIQSLVTVCDTCRFIKQPGDQIPAWHAQLIPLLEQALQVSRNVGDVWAEMMILHRAAFSLRFSWQNRKAIQYWEQAADLARKDHHIGEEYYFLNIVTSYLLDLGDYRKALECDEKKRSIARKSGWTGKEGQALLDMARLCSSLGDDEKAIRLYKMVMELNDRIATTRKDASFEKPHHALHEMAKSFLELGQYKKATDLCEKSLEARDRTKLKTPNERAWADREDGSVFETMGEAYKRRGKLEKAIDCFLSAWWRKTGQPSIGLAEIYLAQGRTEEAEAMAQDGQWGAAGLGRFYLQKRDYDKAMENYEKMLAGCEKTGTVDGLFIAYTGLGRVWEAKEDYEKAKEYYEKAERLVEQMKSCLPPGKWSKFYNAKVGLYGYGPVAGFRRSEPADGLTRVRTNMKRPTEH